jgi:predicted metal-binding transcription factor (methanogenesis marker protein 9)
MLVIQGASEAVNRVQSSWCERPEIGPGEDTSLGTALSWLCRVLSPKRLKALNLDFLSIRFQQKMNLAWIGWIITSNA